MLLAGGIGRLLEKRGPIERDVQSTWLNTSSESEADPMVVARTIQVSSEGESAQSRFTKRRCGSGFLQQPDWRVGSTQAGNRPLRNAIAC
jgi:hypothetical protein